jgi:hypothetical protein
MKNIVKAMGLFSGSLAAAVPLAKCPICAAAAAGVFGSLGIATLGFEPWFLPLLSVLLIIGLWGFFQTARHHGKWQWFLLAVLGSALVVGGRISELAYLLWSGTIVLIAAYVFDLRAKRQANGDSER